MCGRVWTIDGSGLGEMRVRFADAEGGRGGSSECMKGAEGSHNR